MTWNVVRDKMGKSNLAGEFGEKSEAMEEDQGAFVAWETTQSKASESIEDI